MADVGASQKHTLDCLQPGSPLLGPSNFRPGLCMARTELTIVEKLEMMYVAISFLHKMLFFSLSLSFMQRMKIRGCF